MRDIFLSRPQAREHLVFPGTFAPNVFINAPVRTKRTAAKTCKGIVAGMGSCDPLAPFINLQQFHEGLVTRQRIPS